MSYGRYAWVDSGPFGQSWEDVGSGCMFRVPWGKWEKQFACTTGLPHDQAVRFTKLKRVNLELQLSAHTEYA